MVHPLVLPNLRPQEPYPLPCLNLITLITYLFFPVTLRLSCLPLACITLTYHSRHPIAARVLAYQHGQPLVLADKRTCPPSLCEFITLITYQFSFFLLTLCLSCLPLGQPVRAYPSPTYLVGLPTTYVIKVIGLSTHLTTHYTEDRR